MLSEESTHIDHNHLQDDLTSITQAAMKAVSGKFYMQTRFIQVMFAIKLIGQLVIVNFSGIKIEHV